jgi:hypothetical protein
MTASIHVYVLIPKKLINLISFRLFGVINAEEAPR